MTSINNAQRYILQNFLNGTAQKYDDSKKLQEKTAIKESDTNLIKKSIEKYLKDFAYGNISYENFEVFMKGLGATDYSQTTVNSNIVQKFTVDGKKYEVTCNKNAAKSGTDKNVDKNGSYTKYNEWQENITGDFSNTYNVNGKITSKCYYNKQGKITSEIVYKNDEKIGVTTYKYDAKSNLASVIVSNYNKDTDKNIPQSEYVHNYDGTVTMYTYDKDGKTKHIAGTFKEGEFAYLQPSDLTKTKTKDRFDKDGIKIGTYEYEYDANGNTTVRRTYDLNGKLTQTYNYMRDKNGKYTTGYYIGAPNASGNYTIGVWKNNRTEENKTYNSEGNLLKETNYSYNSKGTKTGYTQTTYDPKTGKQKITTVYNYDSEAEKNIPQTQYVHNSDGTVTMYTFDKDGKTKHVAGTFKEGEFAYLQPSDFTKTRVEDHIENGKKVGTYEYECDANGNTTVRRSYDLNGKLTQTYNYMRDKNGKYTTGYYIGVPNASGNYTIGVWKNSRTEESKMYNSSNKLISGINYEYSADGTKIGQTEITYDAKTGKSKTATVYSYDKATNKKIPQIEYLHNSDGTVTMYLYDDAGKKKYYAKTYKEKDVEYIKPSKLSKIQRNKYGIYLENPQNYSMEVYISLSSSASYTVSIYEGYNVGSRKEYSSDGKLISEIKYSFGKDGANIGQTQTTYDANTGKTKTTTVYSYDKKSGKNIPKTQYVHNSDGTVTMYTYDKDGKTKHVAGTFKEGEFAYLQPSDLTKTKVIDRFDSNGKKVGTYEYEYDANGNTTVRRTYDLNGKLTQTYNYMRDKNGKYTTGYYIGVPNASGNYTIGVWKNDRTESTQTYNSAGKLTAETEYTFNSKGQKTGRTETKYTYDSKGKIISKTIVSYDKNGKKTGSKKYTYNSNGTITYREYDANGKTKSGREQISGNSITISGITLTTQKIYDALISNINNGLFRAFFTFTAKDALEVMGGKYTASLLEAAQTIYNPPKKPLGCDGKVYNCKDEGIYSDYLYNLIQNACGSATYGYDPYQISGYHWSPSSELSKTMAKDSDLKSYVKNNIKALINGNVSSLPAAGFKSNKDLYYAIAGVRVMESKLSGTTLKLKLVDVYDFNMKNIDKTKKSGTGMGAKFDGIGAAAMKDGKLKPYYEVFEVNIDLKTIFSEWQLKELGII